MTKLEEVLQNFRSEIGSDFISTDITSMSDGLSIAGGSAVASFDSTAASALFTAVMSLANKVSTKLNLGGVEDDLATTDHAFILARLIGDGSYYWGVAVAKSATLGVVRIRMNEYAPKLWEAIPR
jgi:predicted regulator of Ras-like GTPase activity (Roadblock/LC7/MglB family)